MYTDETLNCVDCSAPFTFTTGEQEFFASKGFTNKPNRCPDCRAARKAQRGGAGGGSSYSSGGGGGYGGGSSDRAPREMFEVKCSQCGNMASVPFQPRGDKPVYCRDCFQSRGGGGGGSYR
jgi:CxxC-x17-CxxC domain-containing protein